ncbi:DVU3141 family protein [Salinicola rhizosphaerae]|uniref:Common-antigen outer membrane protein n=1 Tax=Salinicola rhizosphaerae TaxID=1443141 RepID=A0ABQ3DP68_9GAMM|nr:DVU3141 family protein [Salinicola rhizosphaerae]GHB06935.1 hypothetical protein GCM10009038_00120 [Salinicola rhizosphaerae]
MQIGALVVTLAGCASQGGYPGSGVVGTMPGATPAGPQISSFLDNATSGSIASFPKSPWGSNVSVIVQDRYFAASGRLCTHLDVAREGTPQSAHRAQVACLVQDKGWYTQRLVTQTLEGASTR